MMPRDSNAARCKNPARFRQRRKSSNTMLMDLANVPLSFDSERPIGDVSMQHEVLRPGLSGRGFAFRLALTRACCQRGTARLRAPQEPQRDVDGPCKRAAVV